MSTSLCQLVEHLASELQVAEIPDYPGSMNGLQLENRRGEVTRIAAAVDATLPVIEKAVAAGADLLIVHHGMFWQGAQPITKAQFTKLQVAMDAGLAIYSVHIPLDVHPVLGNNALLVKALGLQETGTFFDWKGIQLGVSGKFAGSREDLKTKLEEATGGPAHLCPGGAEAAGKVGVITGGAGSEVGAVAAEGIDTFVTGEGQHWTFTAAEELGINLLYGGHYATETFGVKALAGHLEERFGLPWEFVDHPTGL